MDERALKFVGPLPDEGAGALEALRELLEEGLDASISSSGPRFFHYVIGGATPAALAAAWLTDAIDQNAGLWPATPLGSVLGKVSIDWLRDLFGLPESWGGALVTGGTMANYVGLAAARRWCGLQRGVDVDEKGLTATAPISVFSSGYIHASARKAIGMLGMGRENVRTFARDEVGRLDADGLRSALASAEAPAIVIANAGEVNAGDFDPIDEMADLAEEHGAWLHVDGAFGLFAAISPRTRDLVSGIERAHSVSADGHKWLNVPHDTGFTFVRQAELLDEVFNVAAAYLTSHPDQPNLMFRTPESSQRARGIAVWATLRAYGRAGYREIVERHLDLAQRVARRVDEAPTSSGWPTSRSTSCVSAITRRASTRGLASTSSTGGSARRSSRMDASTSVRRSTTGKVAFRPAIVNWRTREKNVDLIADVVREFGVAASR